MKDPTRIFYDEDSRIYEMQRFASRVGQCHHRIQGAILRSILESCGGVSLRILDVGAGTGRMTRTALSLGHDVVALDFSGGMLAIAKSQLADVYSDSFRAIQADSISLPFPDNSFDICMSINVIGHVPDFRRMLSEMARVLKPGGYILLNYPNLNSVLFVLGYLVNRRKRAIRRNVFSQWFRWQQLQQSLADCGVRVIYSIGQPSKAVVALVGKSLLRNCHWRFRIGRHSFLCPVVFVLARRTS